MEVIYVVFKTARQIEGEYNFISAEKAFKDSKKAEEFWRQQTRNSWREEIQGVMCECERAIHEVALEE